jgi:hypothetical protein
MGVPVRETRRANDLASLFRRDSIRLGDQAAAPAEAAASRAANYEMPSQSRIAELCSQDWGLWRTTTETISRTRAGLLELGLPPKDMQLVEDRLDTLSKRIDREPKSRRWRLRDRVGGRVRWYAEPEEDES